MTEFDSYIITRSSKINSYEQKPQWNGKKRKNESKADFVKAKRKTYPAYFLSELAHVISFTDELLPFSGLCSSLTKANIAHSGVEEDDESVGLLVKIIQFAPIPTLPVETLVG